MEEGRSGEVVLGRGRRGRKEAVARAWEERASLGPSRAGGGGLWRCHVAGGGRLRRAADVSGAVRTCPAASDLRF